MYYILTLLYCYLSIPLWPQVGTDSWLPKAKCLKLVCWVLWKLGTQRSWSLQECIASLCFRREVFLFVIILEVLKSFSNFCSWLEWGNCSFSSSIVAETKVGKAFRKLKCWTTFPARPKNLFQLSIVRYGEPGIFRLLFSSIICSLFRPSQGWMNKSNHNILLLNVYRQCKTHMDAKHTAEQSYPWFLSERIWDQMFWCCRWICAGRMEVPEAGKSLNEKSGSGVSDSYVQDHCFLLDYVERDQSRKELQG